MSAEYWQAQRGLITAVIAGRRRASPADAHRMLGLNGAKNTAL